MKKLLSVIILLSIFIHTAAYWNQNKAKEISEHVKVYIEKNIPLIEKYTVYDKVRNRVKELIISLDSSETKKRQLLKDIAFYHNNNILELVHYITSREWATQRFKDWKDKWIQELKQQEENARKKYNISGDVLYVNNSSEIVKDGEIYKVSYTLGWGKTFFKEGIWIQQVSNISFERKIPFYEIIQEWVTRFLLYGDSFFEENGYFQTYEYSEYYPVNTSYGVYKSDFQKAGFDYEDAVFLRLQDAKNNVTIKPKKRQMFPISYLRKYWELEKDFINKSVIDILRTEKNYEETYKSIIQTVEDITDKITDEEKKIKAIYDWMVQNVTYPKEYDLEDYKIFSGLEAFENGSAVCEWQVLLMYYLLKIAWVKNVKYIDWYVVNAEDFPKTRHAWIEIWDYFYDPSFEKVFRENEKDYLYYKIPYDIMYTNRYNTRDIPDGVLIAWKENISKEVDRRRYLLTEKYGILDRYKLLEEAFFKKKYNIPADSTITLQFLLPYIEVYDFYMRNWKPIQVLEGFQKEIFYYPISDELDSIESILIENNYDILDYVLLRRYNDWVFLWYGLTKSIK